MFRSFIKISWRNLLKSKAYSLINISGLAIGLACVLAIGLFIADEYSYDRFHSNAANIYRVVQRQKQAGELYDVASSPGPMGQALQTDFPEVVNSCLLGYKRAGVLQRGEITVEPSSITMADRGFLKIFDFPLLIGNKDKVFTEPDQVVITERMAVNLFGKEWAADKSVLGSIIIYNKKEPLSLAGVIKDPPSNSHIQFDVILTYDPAAAQNNNWFSNNYHTYILLKGDADPIEFDRKLEGYINKYRSAANVNFEAPVFFLQPLTKIYLYSDFDFQTDWSKTSSVAYVRIFSTVAMIVLLIAVFNFINLSTARAIRRAKEVGIRKTIGAYYWELMAQFLSESLLVTGISVAMALALTTFCLPYLNELAAKSLALPFTEPRFLGIVIMFYLVVSVLAGLYPSVYLSNFQPIKVLKGVFNIYSGRRFRQALIVTQFSFTVILVAGSIIIHKQLTFLVNKDLGFDQSHLIYLKTNNLTGNMAELLRHDLQQQLPIADAVQASNSLIDVINSTSDFEWEGKTPDDKFLITQLNAEPSYLSTTGMKVIAGRNFSTEISTDTATFLINETAAKRMGWTASEALGKTFSIWGIEGQIIGVLDDFHFRPMTAVIEPFVFMYRPGRFYGGILVKANPTQLRPALSAIEDLYKKYEAATPATYYFVDQQLEKQYQFEARTGKIMLLFSILAVFVACLGLYGLATFTAERRTKEIGIRKVMGASIANVGALLSKDFIGLIIVSTLIASPVGYLLMRKWLEGFAYRIEPEIRFFLTAAVLPLSIAALTVIYQAITAARMDPVKSLRTE